MIMNPAGIGPEIDCASESEGQQQLDRPIFSSERMLHKDHYRKSSVEKSLVMDLKGPDAKTN
jgi:hypothetical protein